MGQKINLLGNKFGKLTVIERDLNNKNKKNSKWLCICECGKKISVSRPSLRKIKSCGCSNPKIPPPPVKIDLFGKTIYYLTAIRWVGGDQSNWICKCKCGKETIVQRHDFLRGKRKSCGCRPKEYKPDAFKNSKSKFKKSNLESFLKRVNKTDYCWIWTGPVFKTGYGQFTINYKHMSSHRASWILHKGEIPMGKLICHHCDNRKCVNPDHLYIGTHKTNAVDRVNRNFSSFKKGKICV